MSKQQVYESDADARSVAATLARRVAIGKYGYTRDTLAESFGVTTVVRIGRAVRVELPAEHFIGFELVLLPQFVAG